MTEVYIIDAVRTPRARKNGKYSKLHPVDLLTIPMLAIQERNNLKPELLEDVIIGCVTQTKEQAWCIARAGILAANWNISIPGTTVNRLCGSGQQACNFAAQAIKSDSANLILAGGVEHMTRVPMFSDCGGEDSPLIKKAHPDLVHQGLAAELLAKEFNISRSEIDEFSCQSQIKAFRAQKSGKFDKSLVPVEYLDENGNKQILSKDDVIRPETNIEGLAKLKTVFKEDGVITAGNASAIVDGSACILLASDRAARGLSYTPRARILSHTAIGSDPRLMLTGPVAASRKVLEQAGLKISDIDLWEINEAFAPVVIHAIRELDLNPELVNVNGGGISLGHPLGATGAMLIGMALDELEQQNKRYALVTMCIGLGMGIATIIERI